MLFSNRLKVGLSLSSGGPRGLAHIGVLKVIEKHQIPINFITGASMGSVVGAFYAAGYKASEIEKIATNTNWQEIVHFVFSLSLKGGIINANKVESWLRKYLGNKQFSDLIIPFEAMATNLETGEPESLKSGSLVDAIIASSSLPLFLCPKIINGQNYIDGGASCPIPINAAKKMGANIVIAVNVNNFHFIKKNGDLGFADVTQRSLHIYLRNLSHANLLEADLKIEPETDNIFWKDLLTKEASQKAINLGEIAAEKALKYANYSITMKKTPWFNFLKPLFNLWS